MLQFQLGKPLLIAAAIFLSNVSGAVSGMTISGTPPATATVGERYFWRPTVSGADDATLQFAYVNRPGWSNIYRSSGAIIGVPAETGIFTNIRIMAGDGVHFVETPPFTITVQASSAPAVALKISGAPPPKAIVGEYYQFTPTVVAAAGAVLRFSIAGKPGWAQFNTSSGALSGVPAENNAGNRAIIDMSVTDGTQLASLPPFEIDIENAPPSTTASASLNWTAPLENTDGSALTNLAGYVVRYGENSGTLSTEISLPASATGAEVSNLSSGHWYFRVAAFNTQNVLSQFSPALDETVP